jgi:hypothetical protein
MCNLYSITTNQAAIIALFRVIIAGWQGILFETGSKAAFWNDRNWTEYPVGATRSMKAFSTEAAALDWTGLQSDSIWRTHERLSDQRGKAPQRRG